MNRQLKAPEKREKRLNRDLTYNWVSSSTFLFYLLLACIFAFCLGSCYMLYTKRFHKPDVHIQSSTLYTPQYK